MKVPRTSKKVSTRTKFPPAKSSEERESQLVNLSMDVAEEQLRSGTASSQVITHFLKLGTIRERLENEKLRSDLEVARAKIKQMESHSDMEEMYKKAIGAMRSYNGYEDLDQEEEDYYYEGY